MVLFVVYWHRRRLLGSIQLHSLLINCCQWFGHDCARRSFGKKKAVETSKESFPASPGGRSNWEHALVHTDDCLCWSYVTHQGQEVIRDEIGKHFKFKDESAGDPDVCLGGKLRLFDRLSRSFISHLPARTAIAPCSGAARTHRSRRLDIRRGASSVTLRASSMASPTRLLHD